jgi:hypothetical protein
VFVLLIAVSAEGMDAVPEPGSVELSPRDVSHFFGKADGVLGVGFGFWIGWLDGLNDRFYCLSLFRPQLLLSLLYTPLW